MVRRIFSGFIKTFTCYAVLIFIQSEFFKGLFDILGNTLIHFLALDELDEKIDTTLVSVQ